MGRAFREWPGARSVLLAALLVAAVAPAAARPSRYETVLAPADSLALHGQEMRAVAYADSVLRYAQANGDRALECVVASRRVLNWVGAGRLDEGAREAARVAALCRAERDTISWARSLLAEGRAHLFRDRLAEAAPLYRQLLPLARAVHDSLLEGNAHLGLAYLDLQANRAARAEAGYRRAVRLLERTPDLRSEMAARVGLARSLREQGRMDEARASYHSIIERCQRTGDRYNEADAWNNLGEIERAEGEPGRAAGNFARARELTRSTGRPRSMQTRNLAIMLLESGQVDAAADTLASELARWPRASMRETYSIRIQLAMVRDLQGRRAESERMFRELWAVRDSVTPVVAADAGIPLVTLLHRSGRTAEARALALEMERSCAGRLTPTMEVSRVLQLAELDCSSGRAAEALEGLRRLRGSATMAAAPGWHEEMDLETELSRAFHANGMTDSAIVAIRRAGDAWERTASGVKDAEWYEPFANSAGQLAIQTARVLLDPRRDLPEATRVRQAFDGVQRFKSRALDWRTAGSSAPGPGLATATSTQKVLRAGEVLLDAYSSQYDTTVVFALDRGSIRAHWVTIAGDEGEMLQRTTALLKSGDASTASHRSGAARRLAADVFGPALDLVKPANRVLCSLSGLLNAIPVAALPADSSSDVPMVERRSVVTVPSASWLARARRAGPASVGSAVVVTLARTTDDQGRTLAGVRDEARWMSGRYGDAGLVHAGDRPLSEVVPWISRGDILHVSSHARTSMHDPWSSAFLLGRGDGEDAWLSARVIAGRRLGAKLAVLASCRTTLDRGFNNESVLGLARAFLAAGVPAVLSTLWPVDDRATVDFTRRYYLALEKGLNAAEALRDAQSETRRVAASAAPYFWAGFVLSGDPDTRVKPKRTR